VEASEERQIVRHDPARHEAIRFQPVCAARQGQLENSFMALGL
jgi:hypothetical protein